MDNLTKKRTSLLVLLVIFHSGEISSVGPCLLGRYYPYRLSLVSLKINVYCIDLGTYTFKQSFMAASQYMPKSHHPHIAHGHLQSQRHRRQETLPVPEDPPFLPSALPVSLQ